MTRKLTCRRIKEPSVNLREAILALFAVVMMLSSVSCVSAKGLLETAGRVGRDYDDATGMAYGRASEKPIVNGTEVGAEDAEARSAVLLLITRGSSLHACTGVFVKPKVLFTAAHCVSGVEPRKIRVVFQTRGLAQVESVNDMNPSKIFVHEKYDGKPENYSDVALLMLPQSAPSGYETVALLGEKDKVDSDQVLLLGYGITGETKKDSMVLRKTTKSFKSDVHIKPAYFGIDQKSETGGFCRGDSGAPVFVDVGGKRRLFGINSFTVGLEKDRECHTASVGMASTHFKPWIEKNAKKF